MTPAQPFSKPFTKAAKGACCSQATWAGASTTTRKLNPHCPKQPPQVTRRIQVNHLPDNIPIHITEELALTRCTIPDAVLYDYDSERDAHHYILVEVKYCRDTDSAQQRKRASQQHQVLKERDNSKVCNTCYCRPSDLDARSVRSNLHELNHGSP
jgi:hypothetical protein